MGGVIYNADLLYIILLFQKHCNIFFSHVLSVEWFLEFLEK